MQPSFDNWFETVTDHKRHEWQATLAQDSVCRSRLIRIPTGLGKTLGVMSTWLHNRVVRQDDAWPRRLVWCLPMRVLVEQTEAEARRLVEAMGLRWDEHGDHTGKVGVHLLMGGTDTGDWHLYPEECAILIGTQDMLLSRALNRGYASSRARWPMEFGLLNSDCLWVMDEVQLMGPGLWTSGQLDWMRNDRFGTLFPCHTWWMSATNSAGFLDTLDRQTAKMRLPDELSCSVDQVPQGLRGARRPCRMWQPPVQKGKGKPKKQKMSPDEFLSLLAGAVGENHLAGTLSLVVCNRVKTAQDIYRLLNTRGCGGAELVLLTSRFRRGDREVHTKRLLSFEANRKAGKVQGGPGLICVATQVVEAGVDISATRLWSEVAPWPCLVQRMGRLNRDGRSNEHAQAVFFEVPQAGGERKATDRIGPYAADDVNLGRSLAERLCQVHGASDGTVPALEALARVSHSCQADVDRALAPKPEPFPRAIDVHGLFDTEPDLFGGFTDVSPFIRGQDEQADVTVFWREFNPAKPAMVPGDALTGPAFDSDEGCSVAVHRLRGFLDETNQAWVWGEAEGCWREIRGADVCPGMVVLLPRSAGGYSEDIGWTGTPADKLTTASAPGPFEEAFAADPPTEQGFWVMIPDHLADAVSAGQQILERLGLGVARPLVAQAVAHAIAHHDIGKALLPWQNALPLPRPKMDTAEPWAKAPLLFAVEPGTCDLHPDAVESVLSRAEVRFLRCPDASPALKGTRILWQTDRPVVDSVASRPRTAIENLPGHPRAYMVSFRPGLRHELASGLALWHQYFREGGNFPALSIYLATTHHGKVRTILTARNLAGDDVCGIPLNTGPLPWQGGMPMDFACVVDGCAGAFTPDGTGFVSESPGWTALVADLLGGWEARPPDPVRLAVRDNAEPAHLGPFALAYLEAVVRCGDARASRNPSRKVPVGGSES